jgi:hypothetical protein
MKESGCKKMKQIMVEVLSGELTGTSPQSKEMADHLNTCSRCRREYGLLQKIYSETRQIDEAAEAAVETIDWEENARDIVYGIRLRQARRRTWSRGFSFQPMNWKWLVPTLAGVFLLGICLGYLLFYNAPRGSLSGEEFFQPVTADNAAVIDRLEGALARRQVQGYFQQTELLLTDLMRQCDEDGTAAWLTGANRQRVRTLLNKNRYLEQDLTHPELLSTHRLVKKIEWVLYEMSTLKEGASCSQLQRLQDYIRQERLLLKLRLVGKDISPSYSEVYHDETNI